MENNTNNINSLNENTNSNTTHRDMSYTSVDVRGHSNPYISREDKIEKERDNETAKKAYSDFKKNKEKKNKIKNNENNNEVSSSYNSINSANKEGPQENIDNSNNKKIRRPLTPKEKVKRSFIVLGIIIGILATLYLIGVLVFTFIFGANTTINNYNASFRTVNKVSSVIEEQVQNYTLTIRTIDNKTYTVNGDRINISYIKDNKLKDLLDSQNPFEWPLRFFYTQNTRHHATVEFDKNTLNDLVNSFEFMDKSKMEAPRDAYPKLSASGYTVAPEYKGSTIDESKIYDIIANAVTNTVDEVSLETEDAYVEANIKSNNPDLKATIRNFNEITKINVTFMIGDKKKILNGTRILHWFTLNPDATLTLDTTKIDEYIQELATTYNSVGTLRTFKSVDGNQYQVEGGTFGYEIDQAKEKQVLLDTINSRQSATREVEFLSEGKVVARNGHPDWGNTYIELNLTKQHMYYIQDGNVVFEADVVTGSPTPARITPNGVFTILEKKSPATLVGEIQADGQP